MKSNNPNFELNMFFGAGPEIFQRASELRKNMTEAEKALWAVLRKKQINGKRFRRQHPISTFIVDFYCHEEKLIIEVDGGIHKIQEQKEKDLGRSAELELLGLTILRFTNEKVLHKLEHVILKIRENMGKKKPL